MCVGVCVCQRKAKGCEVLWRWGRLKQKGSWHFLPIRPMLFYEHQLRVEISADNLVYFRSLHLHQQLDLPGHGQKQRNRESYALGELEAINAPEEPEYLCSIRVQKAIRHRGFLNLGSGCQIPCSLDMVLRERASGWPKHNGRPLLWQCSRSKLQR